MFVLRWTTIDSEEHEQKVTQGNEAKFQYSQLLGEGNGFNSVIKASLTIEDTTPQGIVVALYENYGIGAEALRLAMEQNDLRAYQRLLGPG